MKEEVKICQNCKTDFVIKPEDFKFYEKIKIPPPTFCPECRTVRRLCWRNEMSLFRRKCDAPGHTENLISFIHPNEKVIVCDGKYWWGDEWNPLSYGKEYDFSKSFFLQWKELRDRVPLQCLSNIKATNSDYCNVAEGSKDSYLCSGSWQIERTFYSNRMSEIKDSSDLYVVHKSELCYEDLFCTDCFKTLFSKNCKSCVDSYFLYDCHGCTNCFACTNLRNKSYCMWNKQLSRESYLKELGKINLKSHKTIEEIKKEFNEFSFKSVHKFSNQNKTVGSTGDNLEGVKNCRYSFDAIGNRIEDCKYIHHAAHFLKDTYDSGPGCAEGELLYETFDTAVGSFRNLFTSVVYSSNNVEYSFNCHGCDNLFGCIGLRTKKYCILNKQYSKEEYERLIPKIKEQMIKIPYVDSLKREYRYGEFFPAEMSTFAYNETVAQDYFPLTKEEALKRGYKWRDKKINEYITTIESKDLPDSLDDIKDSIFEEIIGCENKGKESGYCKGAYKITLDELNLYKKLGIPLPRLCFGCRHEARLKRRNPMKLWRRNCMCEKKNHDHKGKCNVEFKTPYALNRPEIIYCESCYNKEVY